MGLLGGWFAIPLWKRVLAALALGLLFAFLWPQATPAVAFCTHRSFGAATNSLRGSPYPK